MNGAQDLGGAMGFGPVLPEPNEPPFHGAWEGRVLANVIAATALGRWTGDASRFARESLPPPRYLTSSYYEIWFAGLEKVLRASGLVTEAEIAAGRSLHDTPKPERIFTADIVDAALARGWPSARPPTTLARFAVGERVRVRNLHPAGHTRLPGYTRNRVGTVEIVRGCFVYPDTNAHAQGEQPQWCYCVRFDAGELWGEAGDPTVTVSFDAFEPYLDHA